VPAASVLTLFYDERPAITYLRLLDEAEGADWREVDRIVLRIDPAQEPGLRLSDIFITR
jgi:hypothetical protein